MTAATERAARPRVIEKIDLAPNGDEGLEVREDGLWYWIKRKGADGRPEPVWTRATDNLFHIKGRLKPVNEDELTHNWGLLVQIGTSEVQVRRSDISTTNDLIRFLGGTELLFDPNHIKIVSRYILKAGANVIDAYTRMGWQEDGHFVIGDMIIPHAENARVLKGDSVVTTFKRRGSYDEWRDNALPAAYAKPGWIFALLVGLSSPLLRVVGANIGYSFNLTGRSSSGKSVGLMLAAGCWGKPMHDGSFKSFYATSNALEGLAEGHSDIGLPLDEMAKADPKVIRDAIYMLANGAGKESMTASREMRRKRHWRVMSIYSAELSVEDLFRAAKTRQQSGQVVRALDIPTNAMMPDLPVEQVKAFQRVMLQYYGTAGPEFVRRVVDLGDDHVLEMHEATLHRLYGGQDARIGRAAEGFAMLVVVGEIMEIDTTCVFETFERWQRSLGGALDDRVQVARDVLAFIDANLNSNIVQLKADEDDEDAPPELNFADETGESGRTYQSRKGWYRDETVYLLETTMHELMAGYAIREFYAWLRERGISEGRRVKGKEGRIATRGMTVPVPMLKPKKMAVKIDLDRLREVVEELTSVGDLDG